MTLQQKKTIKFLCIVDFPLSKQGIFFVTLTHKTCKFCDNSWKCRSFSFLKNNLCCDAMRRKESEIRAELKTVGNETLCTAMLNWLELCKQHEVKLSSYDRLCITFNSQVKKMTIADRPWKKIKTDDLQQAVNALIPCGYSWSTIKKAYDMLNAFYTFQTRRGYLTRNPMEQCKMPAHENILRQEKEIVYMSEQQVREFCREALSYAYGSSKLKYRYGPAFVFLIYTGLRIGELCALQWKDFDLEKRTVSIIRHAESPLRRVRWKDGLLHIYCNQLGLICRPVAVICCATPVQACCSQKSCKLRLSPAY